MVNSNNDISTTCDRGWLATGDGRGATSLGKLYSGITTASLKITDFSRKYFDQEETPETADPDYYNARAHTIQLKNFGMMLGGSVINNFLSSLQMQYEFKVITDFFLLQNANINMKSLEEIKGILEEQLSKKKFPIVIPLVLDRNSWIIRNHIATIIVSENKIEYFDPKGELGLYQKLPDENSLRDVLEYINEKLFDGRGTIWENAITHQFDIHNCGVFACYYIYQKLKGESIQKPIDLTEISAFRKEMLKICFSE